MTGYITFVWHVLKSGSDHLPRSAQDRILGGWMGKDVREIKEEEISNNKN